jgi:gliding motility-associated-like protein
MAFGSIKSFILSKEKMMKTVHVSTKTNILKRKTRHFATIIGLSVILFSHPGQAQVVINELGVAPISGNAAGGGEFIELFNKGCGPVDISCYTIIWTGNSGSPNFNPTGWTITINKGVILAPCAYYLIGGAGASGNKWASVKGNGHAWIGGPPAANQEINTSYCTSLQTSSPGNIVDKDGQIDLLDLTGTSISSVSYNTKNYAGNYPAKTNSKGPCDSLLITTPLAPSVQNVIATFNSGSGSHGIELDATGTYIATSILTPGAANATNGQLSCSASGLTNNSPSSVNASCRLSCNGTATASVSGGVLPYTYSWSPSGGSGVTASSLCAGTYTCSINDKNGCSTKQIFTITQPTAFAVTPTQTNLTCNGVCTGTATATTSGANGGYTYSWSPSGGSGVTASALCKGTYTCTIQDSKACSTTQTFSITQPTALSITPTQTNLSCNAVCSGSATAATTGGTGSYTYSWSPSGGAGITASSLCQGNYTCTIKDGSACSTTQTYTISQPAALAVAPTQTNLSCNAVCSGTATATTTGGTGSYTYSWSPAGGAASTASALCQGNYTCTVKDGNSCSTTQVYALTQAAVIAITPSNTPSGCATSTGTVSAAVTGGTGAYTYSWTPVGGTASTASALASGTYTVTVHDASNCVQSATTVVGTSSGPTSSILSSGNPTCNGSCTGTATVSLVGGASPFVVAWSPSGGTALTASSLCAGTYTCNVRDNNNCLTTQTVVFTEPAALTLTPSTVPATCGSSNGTASVAVTGGTGAYTYSWSGGGGTGATTIGLSSATYSVLVTDAAGCSQTSSAVINNSGGPTATLSAVSKVTCNTACNGSATVNASGGSGAYTYSWSPSGGNSFIANSLCAGTYSCTVSDANNCKVTQSVTIIQPALLLASTSSSTNVSCNGGTDGSANISVTGGTVAYTYSWSPSGGSASSASGFAVGNYTCIVQDSNGCTTSQIVPVTEPAVLVTSSTPTNLTCSGSANGAISATANGGTGVYTYSWSPSGGTASGASGLAAGTYSCLVTDANGCTSTTSATLTEPSILNDAMSMQSTTCGLSNGTATMFVLGGTTGYTYSWSPSGGAASTTTNVGVGLYTCLVTDANGCTKKDTITVSNIGGQPVAGIIAAGPTTFCMGDSVLLAGTGGGTYSWSTGALTDSVKVGAAGTYTVTVTNNCGTNTATSAITIKPLPVAAIGGAIDMCKGSSDVLTASGGTSYSWSTGAVTPSISVSTAGNYTCVVGNACGTTSAITTVNVNSVTALYTADSVSGYAPFSVNFTNKSSPNATTWSWNFGDGATGTGPNPTHVYTATGVFAATLTVTEANGCTDTYTIQITVSDIPSWIHLPNIFTPNGDGTNDLFLINSRGLTSFELKIYDRWGVQLAHITSINEGWDGRTKAGAPASDGTYYYIFAAKGDDKKEYNQTGYFQLIH